MLLSCQMLSLAKLKGLVLAATMCCIDESVLKRRVHRREGSLLWHWPGVSASERTLQAVWLGESTVAALTTAGKIYTLPKQTGVPVANFMQRLTVRCTTHQCNSLGSSPCRSYSRCSFAVMWPLIFDHLACRHQLK